MVRSLKPSRITSVTSGSTAGERPGLVEDDGVDLLRPLKAFRVLEQDALFRALAGPDHDGRGRRQAHGAGTGDDQDRDEVQERKGKPRLQRARTGTRRRR